MASLRTYARNNPDSPVLAYLAGDDHLWVVFAEHGRRMAYRYTAASAGADALAEMKRRAQRGAGLATYIAQHFRGDRLGYDSKRAW